LRKSDIAQIRKELTGNGQLFSIDIFEFADTMYLAMLNIEGGSYGRSVFAAAEKRCSGDAGAGYGLQGQYLWI
jgi:hypothetical protein